jgi:hypothetical protein
MGSAGPRPSLPSPRTAATLQHAWPGPGLDGDGGGPAVAGRGDGLSEYKHKLISICAR